MKCDECPINDKCQNKWELECNYCKHVGRGEHCSECESITDCKFELREGAIDG